MRRGGAGTLTGSLTLTKEKRTMSLALQALVIVCLAIGLFAGASMALGAHNPEPQAQHTVLIARRPE